MRRVVFVVALVLCAGLLAACEIGPSYDFVVDVDAGHPDADPGDGICGGAGGSGCSLRAAIGEANALNAGIVGPAPSIVVHLAVDVHTNWGSGPEDDSNASNDVDVIGSVTVQGDGHAILGPGPRAFDLHQGTLVLDDVHVSGTQGHEPGGGAVRTAAGTALTVLRSTFTDNTTTVAGACRRPLFVPDPPCSALGGLVGGGAIFSSGSAVIVGSTFVGNTARAPTFGPCEPDRFDPNSSRCAAAWGGAVLATGTLVVANSTFDGNWVMDQLMQGTPLGSAIFATSDAQVTFSMTVASQFSSTPPIVGATVQTSIRLATGCVSDAGLQLGDNLVLGLGCPSPSGAFGPMADNGGPTQTRMPAAGTLGVDALPAERCLGATIDQRGEPRPAGSACDIGPVERQPTDP